MMAVYRPDRRHAGRLEAALRAFRSFKLALLERSLALLPMLPSRLTRRGRLRPFPRLSPGKQGEDLCVVLRRVDIVGAAGRRHGVEELWVSVEDLPCAGIALQCVQVVPKLACQHHRRCPVLVRSATGTTVVSAALLGHGD